MAQRPPNVRQLTDRSSPGDAKSCHCSRIGSHPVYPQQRYFVLFGAAGKGDFRQLFTIRPNANRHDIGRTPKKWTERQKSASLGGSKPEILARLALIELEAKISVKAKNPARAKN
jgi:hypothetical protein